MCSRACASVSVQVNACVVEREGVLKLAQQGQGMAVGHLKSQAEAWNGALFAIPSFASKGVTM